MLCPGGQHVGVPYLDIDLFRFLSGIPDSATVDHELHTTTIRRAFPEFADIPYAHKIRVPSSLHIRKLAVDTAFYLLRSRALLDKSGAVVRLLRSLVSPARVEDVGWLHTFSIYLTQVGLASTGHLREATLV